MKMNKFVKEFLHRGLMFGGFGPIVAGVVSLFEPLVINNGKTIFTAIVSTYILAFIHAGSSVLNTVEKWSPAKTALIHLSILYVSYLACYLVNSWIPFDIRVVGVFTAIFVIGYFAIWLPVYFSVRKTSKKLNKNLK